VSFRSEGDLPMNARFLPLAALLLLAACGTAGDEQQTQTAQAENVDPEAVRGAQESIRARQSHYKQIGAGMKAIGDELQKSQPSVELIQRHAGEIRDYAPQIEGWFPEGSGYAAGLRTEARDEIWSNPEGFRRAAQAMVEASQQFHATAQTGDLAAIRAGVRELGATCKGCHDDFRAKQ
jgi:cytochrome c556